MLLASLREPPRKGSLRESVLLLYCLKREEIAYTRDLAMAQIQISPEKGVEVFHKYQKAMFPWVDSGKGRVEDHHKKLLDQAVKMGPLSIKPVGAKPVKSRLVKQVQKKQSAAEAALQRRKQDELYKKLGKVIPV